MELNKNATPLVVVDMQWDFYTSRIKSVIEACKKEIILAKKRNAAIIFLEYDGFGKTMPQLRKVAKDYAFTYTALKDRQDGSSEVIDIFETLEIKPRTIRVCGVNTDQCVRSTVHGLMYVGHKMKIGVVYEATNGTSNRRWCWSRLCKYVPPRKNAIICKYSQKDGRYVKRKIWSV